jgi:hypothetical protein
VADVVAATGSGGRTDSAAVDGSADGGEAVTGVAAGEAGVAEASAAGTGADDGAGAGATDGAGPGATDGAGAGGTDGGGDGGTDGAADAGAAGATGGAGEPGQGTTSVSVGMLPGGVRLGPEVLMR